MSNPLDTHSYDYNLASVQIPDLILIQQLTIEQKRERGAALLQAIQSKIQPRAFSFLSRIVQAMGTAANIDTTNNLVADDLICLCWNHRENSTFILELEAQLLDMATGFCPQGRTHRLFQILLPFQDTL